ncbi:MAG: FG-GAP repeat protein [Phycisphaerales bacterium]|nr:FG-GAP repeat protein [Phycisphaerales bacterium]
MTTRTFIVAAFASLGIASTGLGERGGQFSVEQKLTASDAAESDYFGHNVSIWGNTALTGAAYDDDNGSNSGSVYVYQLLGDDTWSEVQKLTASDAAEHDNFGQNVAISDDTILIGSAYDDDNGSQSGSAYLYKRQDDGTWSEAQKLTASDASGADTFGNSVAISGTTALVGAYYDDDNGSSSGSAYLYQQQDDGTWSEIQKLTASDGAGSEFFGQDAAISGDTVLIGADRDDDNGSRSGSAYLYYSPTPATTGACCVNTGCDILTLSQCWNLGGVYMAGTSCDECDTVCLPDINGDGTVGVVDLLEVIDAWGICP